ncbi:MAG: hypothetical protein F4120_06740 [Rhodothermaceae bacterium]|nr:hypothetical protein [Rhodothermaceae bacterium]MXW32345.1 hypothetical protein [Rhodothermaceae bacterium]MYC03176.1 hypothetical protein [Rhodothermaceae bacterium]MYE63585.1 hypothetical protein [Rhodothermaceae bacterium]MYI17305.1 hypothetical protein [Rhodothermaceae bacterium]
MDAEVLTLSYQWYKDRLEIISPGPPPNGVTMEKMKEGIVRVTRNGLIKKILRSYRSVITYLTANRIRLAPQVRFFGFCFRSSFALRCNTSTSVILP